MIQTLEAVVNENGKIELLDEISLRKRRRALVTILDEEPKISDESKKEKLLTVFEKIQKADLFREVENATEWQKKLRDEWD